MTTSSRFYLSETHAELRADHIVYDDPPTCAIGGDGRPVLVWAPAPITPAVSDHPSVERALTAVVLSPNDAAAQRMPAPAGELSPPALEPTVQRVRKVILDAPRRSPGAYPAAANIIAIVLRVVLLYAVAVYVPVVIMFAIVSGFVKAANGRGRRRSW